MGFGAWLKQAFSEGYATPRFNYESDAYSILIKGMFGQPPSGRPFLSTRLEAMEIPAVLRGRNLICSLATLPLEEIDLSNHVMRNPLLEQIDPNVPNVVVLAMTIEDLLFESVAWWRVTAFSSVNGRPYSAVRYSPDQVSTTPPPGYKEAYLPSDQPTRTDENVIWMGGEKVPFSQVIRFDSPNPPLLRTIRRAFARALALDLAAEMYANNPRPNDYFTPVDQYNDPDDAMIDELLTRWLDARQKRTTAFVPGALRYEEVQQPTPADLQLVQLQQRVALDIANGMGLDPEDLGISTTSRTYQNGTDRRKDRINDTYSMYMAAITQRLTMPDVTQRGRRVRMNLDDYLRADPKTRMEVNTGYIAAGVMKREYVAGVLEGLPPEAVPDEPVAAPEQRPAIDAGEAMIGQPEISPGRTEAAA